MQPKAEYKTGDITPREVVIVIDTSGSMDGAPMQQAHALAAALIDSLQPTDTFNVIGVLGRHERDVAVADRAAMPAARQHGKQFARRARGRRRHRDGAGDGEGARTAPGNDRIRAGVLPDRRLRRQRRRDRLSAATRDLGTNRIFSIGIGSAPNRCAARSDRAGRPRLPELPEPHRGRRPTSAATSSARTAFPYLTDIKIEWNGLAVGSVTPAAIPDVYAGMPLVVSGIYTEPGRAKITVTATAAAGA